MKPTVAPFVPPKQISWAVTLAVLIVIESSRVIAALPGAPENFDKVEHFCVFGLLATLFGRVTAVQRWTRLGIWLAVPVVSFFGATDEVHQHFTPGRSMDFWDWVADTSGACVAIIMYVYWPWYRRRLEAPLIARQRQVENPPAVATLPVQ